MGTAAEVDDHRRARLRRRADARHRRRRRGAAGQPRPDVALHRGRAELGSDLAQATRIRILPGPSSMWFDALGPAAARSRTCPATTRWARCGTCAPPRTSPNTTTPGSSSPRRSSSKEFALSGSEQNPDITSKDRKAFLQRAGAGQGRTRRRWRRSRTTARTSSSPTPSRNWWRR